MPPGFLNASTDMSSLKANLVHKLTQEESTREHSLAQLRDGLDLVSRNVEHRSAECAAKIENEQRQRVNDVAQLSMTVGDVSTKLEEQVQEVALFKTQVAGDYVLESRFQEGMAEMSGRIGAEVGLLCPGLCRGWRRETVETVSSRQWGQIFTWDCGNFFDRKVDVGPFDTSFDVIFPHQQTRRSSDLQRLSSKISCSSKRH